MEYIPNYKEMAEKLADTLRKKLVDSGQNGLFDSNDRRHVKILAFLLEETIEEYRWNSTYEGKE